MRRAWRPLLYGLLVCLTVIGVGTGLQAAINSGSSVVYTAADTVTMPAGTTINAQILNALGALTASSSFTAAANIALTGVIVPTQITANQNDYNPAGLSTSSVVLVSTDASRTLTGLVPTTGRFQLFINVGTQNLVMAAESASSSAANRFGFPGDLTLIPKAMVLLYYDNSNSRWRSSFPSLTAGPVSASILNLTVQGSDPSAPGAGILSAYAKSTGLHTRDSAGNVVGPLGGGGGGSATPVYARVATTANITLSGEQTLDGILTSTSIVLVKNQSTATQNGLYLSGAGAWTRVTNFDTSAEFLPGFSVYVQLGTLNAGTMWNFSVEGSFTLGSTNVTFVRTGAGAFGELVANKNAATSLGYAGLTTAGKQIWTQNGDAVTHGGIATAGQITPTASTMRVAGSGGPVVMDTGNPRITGCNTAAMDGVELTIEGSDPTNTLTMPTGNGVKLCGNTGSKIFGLNKGSTKFICNFSTLTWREANCPSLQDSANVGKDIFGASDIASALRVGTDLNTHCRIYGKTINCIEGGNTTDIELNIPAGKDLFVRNAGGTSLFSIDEATGVITGVGTTTRTTTIPLRLDTTNFANGNAWVSPQDRTNYDTYVIEFLDTGTGCAYFAADIPSNLASVPAWNIMINHSAASGSGANIQLTAAARIFGDGDAKDAAFTALTLANAGVVAVNATANNTRTTLGATNFNGTVALAADKLLRVELCRIPGDADDVLGVSWYLERSPSLRIDVN